MSKYKKVDDYFGAVKGEFGNPVPSGLLRKLKESYEIEIKVYIELLKSIPIQERAQFHPLIFESLYVLAEHNDADSINQIYKLFPVISRRGYYDYNQTMPLGEAVLNEAYDAINAFLENGVNIECATLYGTSTMGFALNNNCSEDMIMFLFERGAELEFEDILALWTDENVNLAYKLIQKVVVKQDYECLSLLAESVENLLNDKKYGAYRLESFTEEQRVLLQRLNTYLNECK